MVGLVWGKGDGGGRRDNRKRGIVINEVLVIEVLAREVV